ncbi:hypothetical protein M441DRAFT_112050, partial [Trichoderma asperellum CBS 433.97]
MPRRVRKTPWSRTGCSTCKRRRKKCEFYAHLCQTCLRLGLECVQFDIFCPINVVTPTRDSRPTRAVTDGEDQDEASHSSPSSSGSADDAGGSSDAAES